MVGFLRLRCPFDAPALGVDLRDERRDVNRRDALGRKLVESDVERACERTSALECSVHACRDEALEGRHGGAVLAGDRGRVGDLGESRVVHRGTHARAVEGVRIGPAGVRALGEKWAGLRIEKCLKVLGRPGIGMGRLSAHACRHEVGRAVEERVGIGVVSDEAERGARSHGDAAEAIGETLVVDDEMPEGDLGGAHAPELVTGARNL